MIKDPEETAGMEEGKAHEQAESKEYEKYEIEDAVNTLIKAEEIKADADLYKCCQDHMSKKSGHISTAMGKKPGSLDELKSIAKKKAKEESEMV